jgi:hypothetical protein
MTLLPSPSLQQNHKKGEGCHFFATKPLKVTETFVYFFFNTTEPQKKKRRCVKSVTQCTKKNKK